MPNKAVSQKIRFLRKRIDVVDAALINKIVGRLKLVKKINALKKEAGLSILDARREAAIKKQRHNVAKKSGLAPKFLDEVFEAIIHEGKRGI